MKYLEEHDINQYHVGQVTDGELTQDFFIEDNFMNEDIMLTIGTRHCYALDSQKQAVKKLRELAEEHGFTVKYL